MVPSSPSPHSYFFPCREPTYFSSFHLQHTGQTLSTSSCTIVKYSAPACSIFTQEPQGCSDPVSWERASWPCLKSPEQGRALKDCASPAASPYTSNTRLVQLNAPSFPAFKICKATLDLGLQGEVPGQLWKQILYVLGEERRVTWLLLAPTASFDQIPVAALIHTV